MEWIGPPSAIPPWCLDVLRGSFFGQKNNWLVLHWIHGQRICNRRHEQSFAKTVSSILKITWEVENITLSYPFYWASQMPWFLWFIIHPTESISWLVNQPLALQGCINHWFPLIWPAYEKPFFLAVKHGVLGDFGRGSTNTRVSFASASWGEVSFQSTVSCRVYGRFMWFL